MRYLPTFRILSIPNDFLSYYPNRFANTAVNAIFTFITHIVSATTLHSLSEVGLDWLLQCWAYCNSGLISLEQGIRPLIPFQPLFELCWFDTCWYLKDTAPFLLASRSPDRVWLSTELLAWTAATFGVVFLGVLCVKLAWQIVRLVSQIARWVCVKLVWQIARLVWIDVTFGIICLGALVAKLARQTARFVLYVMRCVRVCCDWSARSMIALIGRICTFGADCVAFIWQKLRYWTCRAGTHLPDVESFCMAWIRALLIEASKGYSRAAMRSKARQRTAAHSSDVSTEENVSEADATSSLPVPTKEQEVTDTEPVSVSAETNLPEAQTSSSSTSDSEQRVAEEVQEEEVQEEPAIIFDASKIAGHKAYRYRRL